MTERILDVLCTFDTVTLAKERDATRAVAETCRAAAEEQCVKIGATLRHPDPREAIVKHAVDPLTGSAVMLVATRWIADGGREGGGGAG